MNIIRTKMCPTLEITTVVGCKINCQFCPQTKLLQSYYKQDNQRTAVMSLETFKKCVDKMPKGSTIIFSGAAEPMLNKETVHMIQYAYNAERRFKIRLFTTLEGMTPESFREIEDIPFEVVVLHAPDAEKYANITLDSNYFKVLELVLNKKKKNGKPFVDSCNCQGTFHPDFVKHCNVSIPGLNEKTKLHDRGGNLSDSSLAKQYHKGPMICAGSFPVLNHFLLLPDGTVYLCCMDFGLKHEIGNLLYQSYAELRKSKEIKKVQKGMIWGKNRDILCRTCTYGKSIFH